MYMIQIDEILWLFHKLPLDCVEINQHVCMAKHHKTLDYFAYAPLFKNSI